jgi:hypothetical protein
MAVSRWWHEYHSKKNYKLNTIMKLKCFVQKVLRAVVLGMTALGIQASVHAGGPPGDLNLDHPQIKAVVAIQDTITKRWTPKTGPQVKIDFCRSAGEKNADYESKTETA